MEITDPTTQRCPDYTHQRYAAQRTRLNVGQAVPLDDTEAAELLTGDWQTAQDDLLKEWKEQEAAKQEQLRADRAERDAEMQKEVEKRTLKLPEFRTRVPDIILNRPSQYAKLKLDNAQYIDLWYFTVEGFKDALAQLRASDDDTLILAKSEVGLGLQSATSKTASKNAIPDERITWEMLLEARTEFLQQIRFVWPADHTMAMQDFFVALETHPLARQDGGRDILLAYQAQTRRHYHDQLLLGIGMDISLINKTRLDTVAAEVQLAKAEGARLRSVSLLADS